MVGWKANGAAILFIVATDKHNNKIVKSEELFFFSVESSVMSRTYLLIQISHPQINIIMI